MSPNLTGGGTRGVRSAVATSFWILAAPGALALLVGIGIASIFSQIFHLHADVATAARILLLLVLFDLAISIPSGTFGGTLIGLQRYDLLNASMIVVTIAQAVGWWLLLSHGGGLISLGALTVSISLLGQFSRYLIARRYVPGLSVSLRFFDRKLVRPLAKLSAWFAMIDLAQIVVARLDVIVVGVVVGVPAAGVYAVGQKLAFAAEQVVTPVTKAFLPHSAELAARKDSAGLRATIITGTRLSFGIAGPLCLALGFLAKPMLRAWVGHGFGGARLVVVYLAAATAIAAISRTGFLMLQGVGAARAPAMILLGEAAVNLGLSIALSRTMGLTGVALGTLIAGSLSPLSLASSCPPSVDDSGFP